MNKILPQISKNIIYIGDFVPPMGREMILSIRWEELTENKLVNEIMLKCEEGGALK